MSQILTAVLPWRAVKAGEEGRQAFMAIVRGLFGLSEGQELELSFGCKVPGSPGARVALTCLLRCCLHSFCSVCSMTVLHRTGGLQRPTNFLTLAPACLQHG